MANLLYIREAKNVLQTLDSIQKLKFGRKEDVLMRNPFTLYY